MEELLKTRLEKAEDLMSAAQNELCKPQEDVVPYSVCQKAYQAIVNYLGSFLTNHGEQFRESDNVEDLLASCRAIDEKFNELHLAPLYHPIRNEDVWMSMDTVNSFMAMAENTRSMVLAK